jgi:hypothetical protein
MRDYLIFKIISQTRRTVAVHHECSCTKKTAALDDLPHEFGDAKLPIHREFPQQVSIRRRLARAFPTGGAASPRT